MWYNTQSGRSNDVRGARRLHRRLRRPAACRQCAREQSRRVGLTVQPGRPHALQAIALAPRPLSVLHAEALDVVYWSDHAPILATLAVEQ